MSEDMSADHVAGRPGLAGRAIEHSVEDPFTGRITVMVRLGDGVAVARHEDGCDL